MEQRNNNSSKMAGMVNFKVYLINEEHGDQCLKEIRRFGIDNDVVTNFVYLNEKVQCIFSGLRGQTFSIAWKDAEGDKITISSDEELQIALSECNTDGLCKLYILLERQPEALFGKNHEVFKYGRGYHRCAKRAQRIREKCMQEMEKNQQSPHGVLKMSKDYILRVLDLFGLDFDIEIEPGSIPNTSDSEKSEKKTECQNDTEASTSGVNTKKKVIPEEDAKKFPGKGNKLIEKKNDNEEVMSDTSSTSKDIFDTKPGAPEDWTLVEKNEASNISHASSATNISNETAAKPDAPAELNTKTKDIYPELPENEKIYHSNPEIQQAVETLISMGFSNKNGELTYMLEDEKGNVLKVLERILAKEAFSTRRRNI